VPVPGPDQVLLKVLAASVNNTDINTRIGWYSPDVTGATDEVGEDQEIAAGGWAGALQFPRIQGGDLCGEVVATGKAVTGFSPGQRVICPINQPRPTPDNPVGFVAIGSEYDGAFAQYCVVAAADLYDVSAAPLSNVEIAAIPCAFGTAAGLLHRAGVTTGDDVLITGASGGVGMAAVQLAAAMGAKATGICSPSKAGAVREAGAVETIARGAALPHDHFTHVIDLVAGDVWPALIDALKPGGHYAIAGAIGGPDVAADMRRIYLRDITIHGCTYQPPEVFASLIKMVNDGRIRPLISKTYPLEKIKQAQADFISKRFAGKLVLLPPGQVDDRNSI